MYRYMFYFVIWMHGGYATNSAKYYFSYNMTGKSRQTMLKTSPTLNI